MKKNLWILTEERPKSDVIGTILEKFFKDYRIACFLNQIRILPILNQSGAFSFTYEVRGADCQAIDKIYLKIVSGYSSFVDFLIFFQNAEPIQTDTPVYAIEETKTDDSESRNTGIFQRAAKFIYIDAYYPKIKKIMLYNLKVKQNAKLTDTNIFGTRLLITLGVEIIGKIQNNESLTKFEHIDELIHFKAGMRAAPKGNVPISIIKTSDKIQISGRLWKAGRLSHDPNIGALSLISATLRFLKWENEIEITAHGLSQNHVRSGNKFIKIANQLKISLENLNIPLHTEKEFYWRYEFNSEKLGTIFLHIIIENFSEGMSIYENHAGCERGYFITKDGNHIPVQKYLHKLDYKNGDKSKIIHIPDLVVVDFKKAEIINIEGKKYENMISGIADLHNFDAFEELYIKKYYHENDYKIIRTVVLYGGNDKKIEIIEVSFLLNKNGDLILGIAAPEIFKRSIQNLQDYWNQKISMS